MLIIPLHKNTKFFVCAKFRAQNKATASKWRYLRITNVWDFSKIEGPQVVGRYKCKFLSIINSLYTFLQIHENELISDLQDNIDDKHHRDSKEGCLPCSSRYSATNLTHVEKAGKSPIDRTFQAWKTTFPPLENDLSKGGNKRFSKMILWRIGLRCRCWVFWRTQHTVNFYSTRHYRWARFILGNHKTHNLGLDSNI